jgi:hypothetical protein
VSTKRPPLCGGNKIALMFDRIVRCIMPLSLTWGVFFQQNFAKRQLNFFLSNLPRKKILKLKKNKIKIE